MAETALQKLNCLRWKTRLQGDNQHVEYFIRTYFLSACSSERSQAMKPMHCIALWPPFPGVGPVIMWSLNTSNGVGREKKTEREKKHTIISFVAHMDANLS